LGDSNSDTEEARVDDVSLVGEIMTDLCSNIEGIQTTIPENYHATENNNCVPNEIVPDPICDSKLNLINNSSFEDPVITKVDLWDIFTNVPGWKIAWVGNHEEIPSLELQKGWLASDGVQYAELDGDLVGPSHPTAGASTQISQSINTIVGKNYKLKFNFSGRPNTNETQNILGVTWGGENVAGTPLVLSNLTNQTDWKNYTYDLMATTSITEIAFKDQGVEDSLGTFIDNITLTCEEPGTPVEPTTSKIFFKKYIVGSGVANYQGEGAPSFKLNIMGAGNGDLLLNAANSYSEDSEPVINGNNSVTIYENTSAKDESSNVLPYETSCIPGKYKFAGYGVGNSFVQAAESATTTTDLVLANINQDKYVVVWNELCPNVEQPPVVCENGFHLVENQCVPNQVTPTNVVNSDGGSSNNTSGGRHHESSGGGSGGSSGNQGQVLGASTENLSCEPYLKEYIKFGAKNNPEEVKKLQTFLNQFFEINIPITGFYGTTTFDWVKKFQAHQEAGTLKPWEVAGLSTDGPTGYVYKTTKRWINILKCPEMVATLPIPNLP
jgi:hypothetical protein